MSTVEQEEKAFDPEEADRLERVKRMPSLAACYNLMDFEAVARQVMKKTAWAYYSSGADDEIVCETLNQRPSRPCHHTDDILTISPH
jgi:L-lactate dehydrogenase (cytochrome)